MKKNNNALSPVISAILALLIVASTTGSILLWGIPYIESTNNRAIREDVGRQFDLIQNAVSYLARSTPGSVRINTLTATNGYVYVDDESDRVMIMYSYDEGYSFTVSGFDTCFLAGTKVLMADGSYKNIEDIDIGDLVLSYAKKTMEIMSCRVANVFRHLPEEMTDYYLVINNNLKVTPNHRFYSNGGWVCAGDLKIGDRLFCREQNMVYLTYSIEKVYKRETSFDLEVERCHNYFVSVVDGVDVLVHNSDEINVKYPGYGYHWKRGTTQTIEWIPEVSGTATITLERYGRDPTIIAPSYDITLGSYNWYIPLNQEIGDYTYRINISIIGTPSIYGLSSNFSIADIHEGIIYHETIPVAGGEGLISCSSGDSFTLDMITTQTTDRVEVYWLDYGKELEPPWTFDGAVCIDLYDGDYGFECFGSIWLLDSESLTYEPIIGGGDYKITLENGGIINSELGGSIVGSAPSIFEGTGIFSMQIIQMVASQPFLSTGGSGGFKIRVKNSLYMNNVREMDQVYNLRLQFYGDNAETWLDYFKDNYHFEETPDSNTLFYTPSDPLECPDGVWFTFSHSAVEISTI